MKSKIVKLFGLLILMNCVVMVDAAVKCDSGKPGDTVNCVVSGVDVNGVVARIKTDSGLSFVSCDVCDGDNYTLSSTTNANFKFKIDSGITESKTLTATFAGETASIKVEVENIEDTPDEVSYTVTLVPGNNQTNKTKICKVNSLNSTCNVTLDDLEAEGFNGWGTSKDCTEGAKGNIKVNKDITYYACYKKVENDVSQEETEVTDSNLLLKSLVIKNGEETIDLGFSIRIKEYNITVPLDVTSLVVEAVPQNEDVEVSVTGNEELSDNSQIVITLTDKEKKTSTYKINVVKKDEVKLPLLSNLIIGGYTINFDPNKFIYNITIDKGINELSIEPTAEDENYNVEKIGNSNLKDGSEIQVIVTDVENDVSSTYIIKVNQEKSDLMLYIGIGGILLIILIILLIIVVKKGKNKDNNKPEKKVEVKKGKVVNNSVNIPEVKPAMPTAPVTEVKPSVNQGDKLETLDL